MFILQSLLFIQGILTKREGSVRLTSLWYKILESLNYLMISLDFLQSVHVWPMCLLQYLCLMQGILSEREGSIQLTSLWYKILTLPKNELTKYFSGSKRLPYRYTKIFMLHPGMPNWKGRLSTTDLLVLTGDIKYWHDFIS